MRHACKLGGPCARRVRLICSMVGLALACQPVRLGPWRLLCPSSEFYNVRPFVCQPAAGDPANQSAHVSPARATQKGAIGKGVLEQDLEQAATN